MAVIDVRHGLPDDHGTNFDAIPREYSRAQWDEWHLLFDRSGRRDDTASFPHCDMNILHAPGECAVCDLHPQEQTERLRVHVAFTGHRPLPHETACPADIARPPDAPNDHRRWGGNRKAGKT